MRTAVIMDAQKALSNQLLIFTMYEYTQTSAVTLLLNDCLNYM